MRQHGSRLRATYQFQQLVLLVLATSATRTSNWYASWACASACIYIYIYIHKYIHLCIYMYIYIYTLAHAHARTHARTLNPGPLVPRLAATRGTGAPECGQAVHACARQGLCSMCVSAARV